MSQKDLSIWEWEDVKNWMNSNNLGQYIGNLEQHQVNGYDLCYLTNEDLNEMRLTNFHDRNLILKNVRLLTLEQLKIQIKHDEKTITIQLDFDPNFSIEMLTHSLVEIFKLQGDIQIATTKENEILMSNLKIVELILLHPQKYKNLKIISPSDIGKTGGYARDYLKSNYDTNYANIPSYDVKQGGKKYSDYEPTENKMDGKEIEIKENTKREKEQPLSFDYKYENREKERERLGNGPSYKNDDGISDQVPTKSKYTNYKLDANEEPKVISRKNGDSLYTKERATTPVEPYYEKFRYVPYEDKPETTGKETRTTKKEVSSQNPGYLPSERTKDLEFSSRQRFASEKRNFRQQSDTLEDNTKPQEKFQDLNNEKYTSRFNNMNYPEGTGDTTRLSENKSSFDIRSKVNSIRSQLSANINSSLEKPTSKADYNFEEERLNNQRKQRK